MDFLPYSCQWIEEEDVKAVVKALRAPIISQGEALHAFERAFAEYVNAPYAVGFSSGTAALHAMCAAAGIGAGDEVLVPALTFASTANVVLHLRATPVFVDIMPRQRTIEPQSIHKYITSRTKAIIAVDFAGVPCAYDALRDIAVDYGLVLLADSAHAVGAAYKGQRIGSVAELSAFSFGPVKNMTTGEGGMVTTKDSAGARLLRQFRAHGMTRDHAHLEEIPHGGWYYEQQHLGLNYKMTELAAALGASQLKKLGRFNQRRAEIAAMYNQMLKGLPVTLPFVPESCQSAWHLYAIEIQPPYKRDACFSSLREQGIGVQVHYIPVPMHPFYQRLGYQTAAYPCTMAYYKHALSLPLHPQMTLYDIERVVESLSLFFDKA